MCKVQNETGGIHVSPSFYNKFFIISEKVFQSWYVILKYVLDTFSTLGRRKRKFPEIGLHFLTDSKILKNNVHSVMTGKKIPNIP